jgi:predicted house-cleaning noncanonical NTP pyrophosphatase (MazG superfamily)
MKPEEIAEIKKALQYIIIARSSDHITFRVMLAGDTFVEEVMKPLQKISGWDEEDEKTTANLAEKFAEETKGHTLREKSEKIGKILAVGGIATAIALASGIALVIHDNQKRKKKSNAEK